MFLEYHNTKVWQVFSHSIHPYSIWKITKKKNKRIRKNKMFCPLFVMQSENLNIWGKHSFVHTGN